MSYNESPKKGSDNDKENEDDERISSFDIILGVISLLLLVLIIFLFFK